jgi:hypothetical protein
MDEEWDAPDEEWGRPVFMCCIRKKYCYEMLMPRRACIDAPGALHHAMCRGIERRMIYRDDADLEDFLARLETNLSESQSPCCAWALMPNQFTLQTIVKEFDLANGTSTGCRVVRN